MKKGKKKKFSPIKVWAAVSVPLVVLLLVVTFLMQSVFYEAVSLVLGRPSPVYKEGSVAMYDTNTVTTKAEALANANKKNVEICEEGFVLLKNSAAALPLEKGAKISVFGKNSVNLSYGGSGSGGFTGVAYKTLFDSLDQAGFAYNEALKNFYEDDSKSGPARAANSSDLDSGGNQKIAVAETPQSMYTDDVKNSYNDYHDAAIVVITRIGGEGFDMPRYQGDTAGAVSPDSHYLELDANERDLLTAVCGAGFGKVIVIFNIPSAMEAAFLVDPAYLAVAEQIDAAIWCGFTGGEGIMALGEILSGEVNPSGRTVDTWSTDFTKDPTFVNFGTGCTDTTTDKYDDGLYYFVDYEEGIYVGYRYYETRAAVEGEAWYEQNVVFPFGYGLSYTQFEWTVKSDKTGEIIKDKPIELEVEVKNTGSCSGKDVVQVYAQAPYTQSGIEKAAKVLVGFAKTKELEKAGGSQILTIMIDPYSMASYDYRDMNKNGFYGYELERGEYTLYISRNAHEAVDTVKLSLSEDIFYDVDPITRNEVGNRFTEEGSITATDLSRVRDSDSQLSTVLSRADFVGTFPDANTAEERAADPARLEELKDTSHNNPTDFGLYDFPLFGESGTMTIKDMLPADKPETGHLPFVGYDGDGWDEKWTELLSQCNESELINLCSYGAYQTAAVGSINMPATVGADGPSGYTCFMNREAVKDNCHYCSEPVMASTWNAELIESLGETMGDEGLMGNGENVYSGIYAPGVNLHRSPFGGRCAEYFSEDPFLSGKMAAAEIRGGQKKGVIFSVKHFVANEQETHRSINGDCSYLTEQALRELYLKPFEMAVKEGGTRSIMSSFNRVGTRWTGGDYRLLTEILRNEWGFRGMVICDFNTVPQYMNSRQMAYAGGDLNLTLLPEDWCDPSDMGDAIVLQQNAKNIVYAFLNSNAMRGELDHYEPALWTVILRVVDGIVGAGIVISGAIVIGSSMKKKKTQAG